MKVLLLILAMGALLTQAGAQEKPVTPEKPSSRIDPFADPVEELASRAEKAAQQKRYDELKEAAEELALLSRRMSDEIAKGNKDVVSIKVIQGLDRAEKLVKTMQAKVK
jgi:hypothetical protein